MVMSPADKDGFILHLKFGCLLFLLSYCTDWNLHYNVDRHGERDIFDLSLILGENNSVIHY